MTSITRIKYFEAAHFLPNHKGKCKNLHGHSYRWELTVTGEIDENTDSATRGMIIDFKTLDTAMDIVLDSYDHKTLNDFVEYPTAEILVRDLFEAAQKALKHVGVKVVKSRLYETRDSYAEWTVD